MGEAVEPFGAWRSRLAAMLGDRLGSPIAWTGEVQRNVFSIMFPVNLRSGEQLMVKVPKTDLRQRDGATALVLTDADRALGRLEYESLAFLNREWEGSDVGVRWVVPRLYLDEVNALVTVRVAAVDVCDLYRRKALAQHAGSQRAGRHLQRVLGSLGRALGRLHRRHARPMTVRGSEIAARLMQYVERLEGRGVRGPTLDQIRHAAPRLAVESWPSAEVPTLKGVDIRNVLESVSGEVWLLDPGKMKPTAREADLARFLLTWRILFWGSGWFGLGARPHPSCEAAFVDEYWSGAGGDRRVHAAYELKETLKHWLTATESLALKGWGRPTERLARRLYIEPFYRNEAARLIRVLA